MFRWPHHQLRMMDASGLPIYLYMLLLKNLIDSSISIERVAPGFFLLKNVQKWSLQAWLSATTSHSCRGDYNRKEQMGSPKSCLLVQILICAVSCLFWVVVTIMDRHLQWSVCQCIKAKYVLPLFDSRVVHHFGSGHQQHSYRFFTLNHFTPLSFSRRAAVSHVLIVYK